MKALYPFLIVLLGVLMGLPLKAQEGPSYPPAWVPEGEGIRTGTITVPEDHDQPSGQTLQIAYLVIPAKNAGTPRPPLIFFSGGPGGNTLDPGLVGFLLQHPFHSDRDIILFDQRGIGYSSPMPDMGFDSFKILAADADPAKERELTRTLLLDYRKRCLEAGIAPQYYNTFQNARDVGMLLAHLGYAKYVLFGGSYGTRLARVVQDLYPQYVHCSLLDSPSPLSGDFLLSRLDNYTLALERVLAYCQASDSCRTVYPELKKEYLQAIEKLKQEPMKVRYNDSLPFVVNEQDGVYLLRRLLYQANAREKAPELIRAFLQGNPEPVQEVVQTEYALTGGLNLTMLLSVEKFENFNPEYSDAVIREAYARLPLLPVEMGFFDSFYRAGMEWHPGNLPLEERRFNPSEVPTLIFVNQFDPVTPPRNGHLFMEQLTRGTLLILDEGGHGGGNADCKEAVMAAFMEDPQAPLNTSCLHLYTE